MKDDHNTPTNDPSGTEQPRKTRDARGRWLKGHCPNRKGRPRKKRFKDYNPSDLRHFMNTQIEVATADGPQLMDRRTAVLNKLFEGAMKGKATPLRMLMGMIKENDQQLAELRVHYENLVRTLILDNPDFKSIDVSLTARQRLELLQMATTLNHYHPGQFNELLEPMEESAEGMSYDEALEKLRARRET